MSSKKREAVKVVLMDTLYVETDSASFKSVVQKLTGKDSSVAWIKESNSSSALLEVDKLQEEVVNANNGHHHHHNHGSSVSTSKEYLDSSILEVPPPEEYLQRLWTEHNLHY